jgi:hypothetical protein
MNAIGRLHPSTKIDPPALGTTHSAHGFATLSERPARQPHSTGSCLSERRSRHAVSHNTRCDDPMRRHSTKRTRTAQAEHSAHSLAPARVDDGPGRALSSESTRDRAARCPATPCHRLVATYAQKLAQDAREQLALRQPQLLRRSLGFSIHVIGDRDDCLHGPSVPTVVPWTSGGGRAPHTFADTTRRPRALLDADSSRVL